MPSSLKLLLKGCRRHTSWQSFLPLNPQFSLGDRAPVSAHATTVASFKSSGVTYTKVPLPVDMQVYTGCCPAGPHTYVKAIKKGLISKEPSLAPEAGPSQARQKLKPPLPQNAVASSLSVVLEDIPELVEHIYAPASVPSLKEWLQSLPPTSSQLEKQPKVLRKQFSAIPKKGKKASIHMLLAHLGI